jgi:hypothetical protein
MIFRHLQKPFKNFEPAKFFRLFEGFRKQKESAYPALSFKASPIAPPGCNSANRSLLKPILSATVTTSALLTAICKSDD